MLRYIHSFLDQSQITNDLTINIGCIVYVSNLLTIKLNHKKSYLMWTNHNFLSFDMLWAVSLCSPTSYWNFKSLFPLMAVTMISCVTFSHQKHPTPSSSTNHRAGGHDPHHQARPIASQNSNTDCFTTVSKKKTIKPAKPSIHNIENHSQAPIGKPSRR